MVKVVTDKNAAIGLMIVALVFLGTWPALLCLLERRGRKPQHTFLDYAIPNYLVAILLALTLGNIGDSGPTQPNFTTQLKQDNGASVGFAVAGGVFLLLGNMATQYSLAFIGVSLTEVVASSITVVLGTTFNYFLDARINRAEILFPGVGCFLLAAIIGHFTHASVKKDTALKLAATSAGPDVEVGDDKEQMKVIDHTAGLKASHGSAEYIRAIESRRSIKVAGSPVLVGLSIVSFAGLCYGFFSPAFNLASNDQWNTLPEGVPLLNVYTTYFYFGSAFFGVAFLLNIIFLYHPILGAPKSSIKEWIFDNDGRLIAYAAGTICGFGNGFQFMAGQAAGYAAADAVQALPLVSTVWGIVLFGEYRRSSRKTYILLAAMLLLFAAAVGLLCGSSGTRKN